MSQRSVVHAISVALVVSWHGIMAPAASAQTAKSVAPANLGTASQNEIIRQRTQLFQRMLAQPDDLDAAFAYAALSVRLGDLEAAVATLERMLIFAPGLPRLQLELGLLYYRLNAFETARTYLQDAVAGGAPPEVQAKVDALLARIDAAEVRDVFTAQTRLGVRYQTNANRGPGDPNVILNGLGFVLGPSATSDDDFNLYSASTFHYSKDLEGQGDTFDIDLLSYGTLHDKRDELDIATAELTAGPAFDLGRFDMDNAKLGVFAILSGVFLAEDFYGHAYGAGTRYVAQVNPETGVLLKAEYRRREYHNTTDAPIASLRTGHEYRLGAQMTHILSPNLLFAAGVQGQRATAERDYLEYDEVSLWAGPTYSFESPIESLEQPWIAAFTFGATFRDYAGPDTLINAVEEQDDREVFARASLSIPLQKDGWSILGELEYRHVASNYDTRAFDNFSTSVAIVKRW